MQSNSIIELPDLDPNSPDVYVFFSKFKDPDKGIQRQRQLITDREMIALAQKVAKAFPGIPLMGLDILTSEVTGKLDALELASRGNTWHCSSPTASDGRLQISREARINQFGAWDIAAPALVEKTLYYAK